MKNISKYIINPLTLISTCLVGPTCCLFQFVTSTSSLFYYSQVIACCLHHRLLTKLVFFDLILFLLQPPDETAFVSHFFFSWFGEYFKDLLHIKMETRPTIPKAMGKKTPDEVIYLRRLLNKAAKHFADEIGVTHCDVFFQEKDYLYEKPVCKSFYGLLLTMARFHCCPLSSNSEINLTQLSLQGIELNLGRKRSRSVSRWRTTAGFINMEGRECWGAGKSMNISPSWGQWETDVRMAKERESRARCSTVI